MTGLSVFALNYLFGLFDAHIYNEIQSIRRNEISLTRGVQFPWTLDGQLTDVPASFNALDRILSGRLTILIEAYNQIEFSNLLFGVGVGNFTVVQGEQFPHVELLRYLGELGVFGMVVAIAIYQYPLRFTSSNYVDLFSLYYLICFLGISFLQPSGALTHLNNSFLFWLLFANLIMKNKNQ